MKKLLWTVVGVVVVLILDTLLEDQVDLSEEQKTIQKHLLQNGFTNVSFGSIIPSSDSAYVISFTAKDSSGVLVKGTALLYKGEIRIYL